MNLDLNHPIVARLAELQGTDSDAVFAKRWLPCSSSAWGRIKSGAYHAADHSPMAEKLQGALNALEDHHSAGGAALPGQIILCPFIDLGLKAVKRSFNHPRNRLVVGLAPTGGGKTTLARQIAETYYGRTIRAEATETWRKSYFKVCYDLLEAAGVSEHDLLEAAGAVKAERLLLRTLKARPRCLIIDEAHYFGPATINLVKAILNQTACNVVLLAIPALWNRMNRAAWEESKQLQSRTCAKITGASIRPQDVAAYLDQRLNGAWSTLATDQRRAIADTIARHAAQFGLWNTVDVITADIEDEISGARAATLSLDTVQAATKHLSALR